MDNTQLTSFDTSHRYNKPPTALLDALKNGATRYQSAARKKRRNEITDTWHGQTGSLRAANLLVFCQLIESLEQTDEQKKLFLLALAWALFKPKGWLDNRGNALPMLTAQMLIQGEKYTISTIDRPEEMRDTLASRYFKTSDIMTVRQGDQYHDIHVDADLTGIRVFNHDKAVTYLLSCDVDALPAKLKPTFHKAVNLFRHELTKREPTIRKQTLLAMPLTPSP